MDARGEILQFGVFSPDRQTYTIDGIKVTHRSARSVPITLSVTALRHEETNFPLNPAEWCILSKGQGAASVGQTFQFDFAIRFPKKIPPGMPDGLYVGNLKVESPEAESPLFIPIQFTVDLPDFFTDPSQIAESGLLAEMHCCIPGSRSISFAVATDAVRDQDVKVIAPMILIDESTGGGIQPDQAWVSISPDGSNEADRVIAAGKKTTPISLRVAVADEKMPSGRYTGEVAIRSELGRTLYIPVYLLVPSSFLSENFRTYALIASVLIALIWLIYPSRRLIQGRNRFRGTTFRISRSGQTSRIPSPWNKIIGSAVFLPNENAWRISSNTHNMSSGSAGHPPSARTVTIPLSEARIINIAGARAPRERYRLRRVVRSPASSLLLEFKVVESPFRKWPYILAWLFCLMLLLMGTYSALYPEIWCRFIQ